MIAPHKRALYESLTWRAAALQDIDFLLSAYHQHSGKTAAAVLDIACGNGDYARLFASRGLRVIALENDPDFLQLAREATSKSDLDIHWQLADLRHFAVDSRVDLAVCLRGRLSQLLTNEDLIRHFNAVANTLAPSGLYIIELPHPRRNPLFDQTPQVIQAEQGDISVAYSWPVGPGEIDSAAGIIVADAELKVEDQGHFLSQRTAVARRILSVQEIRLLALQSESMRLVATYGAFDAAQPLDSTTSSLQMIAVLQKVEIPLSYLSPKLEVRPSKEK